MQFSTVALAIALSGFIAAAAAQTASPPPAPSLWKNQSNSILEIESIDSNGVIKGSFLQIISNGLHRDSLSRRGTCAIRRSIFRGDVSALFHGIDVAGHIFRQYDSNELHI